MNLTTHQENQKYSDYIQPLNQNLFYLINERIKEFDPTWYQKTILDYGCNVANLLKTGSGKIAESNYTGIDVQIKSLELASTEFKNAEFIRSEYYHPAFNSNGSDKFPELTKKYDVVFCIGVFTHCDINDIITHIDFLKSNLAPDGYIVFSVWEDFHFSRYVDIFLKFMLKIKCPQNVYQDFNNSLYLVNRSYSVVDKDTVGLDSVDWLETFYKRDFLSRKLTNLQYLKGPHSLHSFFITS